MKINFWPQHSLSRRLMIYSFIFTYLLLIGFWSVLFFSLKSSLQTQDELLVQDRVRTIASLLEAERGPSVRLTRRIEKEWLESNSERILVRVLDSERHTVAETPHLSSESENVLQSLDGDTTSNEALRRGSSHLTRFETATRVYETAIAEASAGRSGIYRIEIALERTSEQMLLSRFRFFFLYLLIIGGAASVWIGRAIVKTALSPIREVSAIAARINSDRLDERIQQDSLPIEFHELATTVNGMLNRLSDSFVRLTRFSEDMAHELRTPVSNLLGSMEVALAHERTPEEYRNIIGSGLEESERLKRIIESLLFIARSADPNQALDRQRLVLGDELRDIISFYDASAEEKTIRIELDEDQPTILDADRTLLQRCIGNLLSNSIRHSPENSKIILHIENRGTSVAILVIDEGCGIPEAALKRIGERFFRVEASRSKISGGTGLGLSISKSIMEMHGGTMSVSSGQSVGTTVELIFPG